MSRIRARLGFFVWTIAPLPCLVAHCGSDNVTHGSADAGDAKAQDASQDASQNDGTLSDALSDDVATGDAGTSEDARQDAWDASIDVFDAGSDASTDASNEDAAEADAADGDAADGDGATTAIPCTDAGDGAASCSGSLTCCGAWCTDTTRDPSNCGACGNTCSATQFCTGVGCDDAILKNLCDNHKATVVLDPYTADIEAGIDMASALATGCTPPGSFVVADPDGGTAPDAGPALDPMSGRPLTGPGNTVVAGGGSYGQVSVGYMDSHSLTPIALGTDGTTGWYQNVKTGIKIVTFPIASLSIHHDYFLFEVSVEPVSGTLCFFGIGAGAPGTTAAAYYFRANVMPQRSTFMHAWYIYEWTDTDADGLPSAGDTFALTAQEM